MQDLYSVLGVKQNASADELKSAFRNLAKQHHPDRGGDPEKFKEINEAYSVLSDTQKRAEYDQMRSGGGPRVHFRQSPFGENWAEDPFHNDFFSIFINAAGMPGGRRAQRNANMRVRLEITLDSVTEDQSKTIRINDGKQDKDIIVNIPKGIRSGAIISYKGMGQAVITNVPPGDLLVEIVVREDPKFTRQDDDLISDVTIDAFDAMLGREIDFDTIWRKRVRLSIPAGTQPGTSLRLANQGLPRGKGQGNGHQFLRINVLIPTNLTAEQREKLADLRKSN